MEDIDIKNFTAVSSVSDNDSILLTRAAASGTHGKIAFGLFVSSVSRAVAPSIVDGVWLIGGSSTGVQARGEDGKTPVFSVGTVTTGLPDTQVSVQVKYDGMNENGNPSYVIDFTIPAGKPGKDGDGAGNVYVTTDGLESGKLYLFQPGADGSANGTMVEFDNQGGVGQQYPGYTGAEIFNDYANNIAAGKNAHAEGQETNATGPRAHAEGYKTSVYAADAHAEGRNTWAMGAQSHVEGMYGIAYGGLSHVEGTSYSDGYHEKENLATLNYVDDSYIRTILSKTEYFQQFTYADEYYYAADYEKLLEDFYVHASFGERNHVEGCNNVCFSNCSHVEGYNNVCGGYVTGHGAYYENHAIHIEGIGNVVATKDYGHKADASHIEGGSNAIIAENGNAGYTHVGGFNSKASDCSFAFAHGQGISVSNDHEAAFGRYNLSEHNGKKVLFAYGIGTSDSSRENAFAVLEDGTVVIPKMEGGNVPDIVDEKIAPLQNRLTNMYSELAAIISKQQERIDSLISLIGQYHPAGGKAYVIQDVLFFTDLMDVEVEGGTLSISDAETTVTNGVLTINQ